MFPRFKSMLYIAVSKHKLSAFQAIVSLIQIWSVFESFQMALILRQMESVLTYIKQWRTWLVFRTEGESKDSLFEDSIMQIAAGQRREKQSRHSHF